MTTNRHFLNSGDTIDRSTGIGRGPNGATAVFYIDGNGNFVGKRNGKPVWATGTKGASQLSMQKDGNLVLYAGKQALWSSGTAGHPGAIMQVNPDGVMVVLTKAGGSVLWASNSHRGQEGLVHAAKSVFPDPFKMAKELLGGVGSAATGNFKSAGQHLGNSANAIMGSSLVMAAFPTTAVPASIVAGAVSGGKEGALKAARSALGNPAAKMLYTAIGMVFPPLAPATEGAVAGMEASSRVLDGLESGDPKKIAAAALQFAATEKLATDGIPGAQRALQALTETGAARDLLGHLEANLPTAKAIAQNLTNKAKSGDKRAEAGVALLQSVTARAVLKKPGLHAPKVVLQKAQPSLMAMVNSAMTTPAGVRVGDFSVLRTGRVLHKGKTMKYSPPKKAAMKVSGSKKPTVSDLVHAQAAAIRR